MSAVHMDQNLDQNKSYKWLPLLLLFIAACGGAIWWQSQRHDTATTSAAVTAPHATSPTQHKTESTEDVSKLTQDQVKAQQLAAAAAAAQDVGVPELKGPITERPDFVSPVEWQILKGIAGQSGNPDQQLTRMVNNLRFAKQQEIWEKMAGSPDVEKRHALAQQLLNAIPARVNNHDMNRAQAQQLQAALLEDLISDPAERRQRLAEEAKRIGVTFSVEQSH